MRLKKFSIVSPEFPIHLPPLRERKEDVPLLIQHFLEKLSRKMKKSLPVVSPEAMDILTEYAWPGNVREIEHSMERILILKTPTWYESGTYPPSLPRDKGNYRCSLKNP